MTFYRIAATIFVFSINTPALYAAGSDTSAPPSPTQTTTKCEKHKVWSEQKNSCVKIKKSQFDDNSIYKNARELAYAGRYGDALELLNLAATPSDPRILNYKAFTNRKMGNLKLSMALYRQALKADPDYILARSYFGQAKMQNGDITGAKQQLAQIAAIDGTGSWAYKSLAAAIKGDGQSLY